MDASALLWERWSAQVKELFPTIHGHQKKTLALFVLGIVLAGNAVLQRVAEGISLHGINKEYALRMRVESTFQDSKRRGWDLEARLVKDEARLDRLLLALFLAMWWVSHLAASCMHHGKRDRFDRTDRHDKGIFRLGRLWLLDILRRTRNRADLVHCLPFRKLAAGWHFSLRF